MSDEERAAIIDYIAANPEAGVPLGGGLRKVRFAREGGGKGGGYRTLFVFRGVHVPLFLVGVFAKNDKSNLTKAEQAHLVQLAKTLLATYVERRRASFTMSWPRASMKRLPLPGARIPARVSTLSRCR